MKRNFFSLFVVVSFLVVGGLQSTPMQTPAATPTPKPGLKIKSMVVATPTPAPPPKRIKGAVAGPTSTPIRIGKGTKTGPGTTPIKIGKDQIKAAPSRAPIKVIKTQVSTPTPTVAPIKVIKTQVSTPTPTPIRRSKDQVTSTTTPIRIPKDGVTGGGGRPGPINLGGPTPGPKRLIPGSHNLPPNPARNLGTGNSAPPPAPAPSSPTPTSGGGSNVSAGTLPVGDEVGDKLTPPGDKLPPSYTEPLTVTVQVGAEPHKPGSNMSVGAKVVRKSSDDGASFSTPVSGAEVSFSLDSAKPLGTAKTYPNGIATLSFQLPWDAEKGSHTLVADVAAGTGHPAGQGSGTFQVADKIVTLKLLLGGKARKGQTIALTASADEDGSPLKTGHALFFIEGEYLGSAPFNQSGTSPSLKWTIPLGVAAGSLKVTAMVANDIASPPSSSVARATAEATLEVEIPVLYFEGADVSRHRGEPAQFSGTLYLSKESKTPAPNQNVIVSWESLEGNCNAKTDAKGQFSCEGPLIPWGAAAGSHAVVVNLPSGTAYGWDFQFHPVSSGKVLGGASLNIVGGKTPSKLKLNLPHSVQEGSKIQLRAKLSGPDDEGITNRQLSFSVNGKPVAAQSGFYNGITGYGGTTQVEFMVPKPLTTGKIKVDAAFAGDDACLPSADSGTMEHFAEKKQAYIKIISAPNGMVGQELTFQAHLSSFPHTPGHFLENVNGIADQPLNFLFDYYDALKHSTEVLVHKGTTGPDGMATVSVKVDRISKHLEVRLADEGGGEWSAEKAETSLNIHPANVEP
jgi:hypothetical protein